MNGFVDDATGRRADAASRAMEYDLGSIADLLERLGTSIRRFYEQLFYLRLELPPSTCGQADIAGNAIEGIEPETQFGRMCRH